MKRYTLLLIAVIAFILNAKPVPKYDGSDFRRISAMIARVLDRNHYSQVPMSEELSGRIFDNFIDDLDPDRIFFTEEDLQKYLPERPLLGYQLQQGQYELAFSIYQDFSKKFSEYRDFSKKFLSGKIDFSGTALQLTPPMTVSKEKTL